MPLPLWKKICYNEESSTFIEIDENELPSIDPSKLYSKEIDESTNIVIYHRYAYIDNGKIVQEQYMQNGNSFDRYEVDDGNFAIYYSYDNDSEKSRCMIDIEGVEEKINFKTYYASDIEEVPVDEDNQKIYYFYKNEYGKGKYKKEFLEGSSEKFKFTYSDTDGDYDITIEKPTSGVEHYECVYINNSENNKYYIYKRVLNNEQVSLYYNDRSKIPTEYREDLTELMKDYILNLYCPDYQNDDYSITVYKGETNRYYRELNGLPPLNVSLYHPKIDRYKINPYYMVNNHGKYYLVCNYDKYDNLSNYKIENINLEKIYSVAVVGRFSGALKP